MTQTVASGVPQYEDVKDVIEALVHTEGRKYAIPGMDYEDIAQEIRLECIRVLKYYDSSRIGPSPYKFLQVCIRHFIYNKRRGIYVPNNPPCTRCPLWDKARRLCVIDEVGCEKIVQYKQNMATKAALRSPATLDVDVTDQSTSVDVEALILDESIKSSLPKDYLVHYEKMKIGKGSEVPARIKRQIRSIVKELMKDA